MHNPVARAAWRWAVNDALVAKRIELAGGE
jgi:hypothetical protein